MKKFGLLGYGSFKKIFNIGDYIQSLAAKQYLPQVNEIIDREKLNEYNEYNGFKVSVIMNGWFMHNGNNWPPSNLINPLFISFHINSGVEKALTSDKSIKYFKQHEPIGCRDIRTAELLKMKGVEAYFSGCLTLTLGETYKKDNPSRERTIFVDPFIPFVDSPVTFNTLPLFIKLSIQSIPLFIRKKSLVSRIASELFEENCSTIIQQPVINYTPIKKMLSKLFAAMFLSIYSRKFSWSILENASYIYHVYSEDAYPTENKRFSYAENLLSLYADSKLVITSRIHCALPCLALNTPVIYIDRENAKKTHTSRLKGLKSLFNILTIKNGFLKAPRDSILYDIGINVVNSKDYQVLASKLIEKCTSFIKLHNDN